MEDNQSNENFSKTLPREEVMELFKQFRSKTEEENKLINWRTTWFIAIQSILVLSVSFIAGNLSGRSLDIIALLLCSMGAAVAVTTYISIQAARKSITHHVEQWESNIPPNERELLPRLVGSYPGTRVIPRGAISSVFLPVAFIPFWLIACTVVLWFESPMGAFERMLREFQSYVNVEELQQDDQFDHVSNILGDQSQPILGKRTYILEVPAILPWTIPMPSDQPTRR